MAAFGRRLAVSLANTERQAYETLKPIRLFLLRKLRRPDLGKMCRRLALLAAAPGVLRGSQL
jgi:hypothetical protein